MSGKLFRINSRIGHSQNDWLEKESEKTGISKSGLMQMALEQYIASKEAIAGMNNMSDIYDELAQIRKQLKVIQEKEE